MRSTAQLRLLWGNQCCPTSDLVGTKLQGVTVWVHRLVAPAMRELGRVMAKHGYIVRPGSGGFNCRHITGGTGLSLHALGIAVDVNPDTNPYRTDRCVTDMPDALIEAIYRIRTRDGLQVFRWGGDFNGEPTRPDSCYDAMHFEVNLSPEEMRRGVEVPWDASEPISTWPTLTVGTDGPAVAALQAMLGMPASERDGVFGPLTKATLVSYQKSRGLIADGECGPQTWTALASVQPALPVVSPDKGLLAGVAS